jgi:hypothetical protein
MWHYPRRSPRIHDHLEPALKVRYYRNSVDSFQPSPTVVPSACHNDPDIARTIGSACHLTCHLLGETRWVQRDWVRTRKLVTRASWRPRPAMRTCLRSLKVATRVRIPLGVPQETCSETSEPLRGFFRWRVTPSRTPIAPLPRRRVLRGLHHLVDRHDRHGAARLRPPPDPHRRRLPGRESRRWTRRNCRGLWLARLWPSRPEGRPT